MPEHEGFEFGASANDICAPKMLQRDQEVLAMKASYFRVSGCLKVRCVNDSDIISTSIYSMPGIKTYAYTKITGIDSVSFGHDIIVDDFVQPYYRDLAMFLISLAYHRNKSIEVKNEPE